MDLGRPGNIVREVPTQLVDRGVSQEQWDVFANKLIEIDSSSTFKSCTGEWICCCLTGFFLIFCCHPVFYQALANDKFQQ